MEAANETCSARGNFALPRTVFPDDTKSPTFGAEGLPANVVAAFREHGSAGEQAEPMPSYVPVQKQGSLSKATHRRASIRTGSADASAAEGGVSGGAGRATGPDSPFFAVRSPPKFLPPVPAFGGSDLAASPAPPPPPPSLNESHNRATEADCFDYAFLPPAVDSLPEVSRQAGQSESPGGSMAGGELEDVRAGALGSQVRRYSGCSLVGSPSCCFWLAYVMHLYFQLDGACIEMGSEIFFGRAVHGVVSVEPFLPMPLNDSGIARVILRHRCQREIVALP